MKPIKYIIESERDALWGMTITTVGYEKIAPGEAYPTGDHLDSYLYSPNTGRILQEYQLVYISEGSGSFESANGGKHDIKPGMLFLLFPDEWHTYRPDPQTGWTQYWIGFKGVNIDERVRHGFFDSRSPVFDVGLDEELVTMFMRAIEVASNEKAFFQQMLAGIVNYMLGLIYLLDGNSRLDQDNRIARQINQARMLMHEKIESDLTIQQIAEQSGLGYSVFRNKFKLYTGLSPATYFKSLKIQRGKELLTLTELSIKEIAYRLNFDSGDHFSNYFRNKVGMTPSEFRKRGKI